VLLLISRLYTTDILFLFKTDSKETLNGNRKNVVLPSHA